MTPLLQQALEVTKLTLALGLVPRATFHEDGVTRESDTTHTTMLGILGVALVNRFPEMGLDPGLVAQFSLVHDFPEAICGDTNSMGITAEAKLAKDCREAEANDQVIRQLAGFPSIADLLLDYHEQRVPEARFVRVLDKVMPKLTHALNAGTTPAALGMSPEEMEKVHDVQVEALCAEYPDMPGPLLDLLREACDHAVTSYCEGGRWKSQVTAKPAADLGSWPAQHGTSTPPVAAKSGFVIERNRSFYAGEGRGVASMQEARVYASEAEARADGEAWTPPYPGTQVLPFQPELS